MTVSSSKGVGLTLYNFFTPPIERKSRKRSRESRHVTEDAHLAFYSTPQGSPPKSNDGKVRRLRAVKARSGTYKIASDARKIKVTDFDNTIPEWDLTIQELQVLYDRSRFKRHFDWFANSPLEVNAKYKLVGTTLVQSCSKTSFKRRIPWLYPDNGKNSIL